MFKESLFLEIELFLFVTSSFPTPVYRSSKKEKGGGKSEIQW